MFSLYLRTIKYLKVSQIYYRLRYKFFKPIILKKINYQIRNNSLNIKVPIKYKNFRIGPNKFKFINFIGDVNLKFYDDASAPKLWNYNLNYFDFLNSEESKLYQNEYLNLIKLWVESVKINSTNSIGWDPYPTSKRIVNWIKWILTGNSLSEELVKNLYLQGRWLNHRIEWHILGNHLLCNAKALIFIGAFFKTEESNKWLYQGLKIFDSQIDEQINNDGGHFELSPMYHSIILEDLLDVYNISLIYDDIFTDEFKQKIIQKILQMFSWLQLMTHPNGELSHFNDTANNIAPNFEQLLMYSDRLNIKNVKNEIHQAQNIFLNHLAESGFINITTPQAVAILDVGKIGPEYQPGHAHADSLSFELSLFGHRVIVNSGTSCYEVSSQRMIERATLAHSTVEINNLSSSEIWGAFRVGRRAYPRELDINLNESSAEVSCAHDGYQYLLGNPIHKRTWLINANELLINDHIDGKYIEAKSRYILYPKVKIYLNSFNKGLIILPNEKKIHFTILRGSATIQPAFYALEFGCVVKTNSLTLSFDSGSSSIIFNWYDNANG